MAAVFRVMAADDAELVRLSGQERQVLHEAHARKGRRNRAELTADLGGGIRFWVKSVHMTWAALHPQQNAVHRLFRLCLGSQGMTKAQETRQHQAKHRKTPDRKKLST